MQKSSRKKFFFIAVKMIVSWLLLTFVFRKAGIGKIAAHFRDMNPWFFGLSCLLYLATNALAAIRWRLLLDKAHPYGKLFSLFMIGAFFNNLLPGAVGGDAVKAYYLYKDTQQGGRSIASVFMDRYIGFAGLLSIGLVSGIIAFRDLERVHMQWITPLMFLAFLLGSLFVFGLKIGRRFAGAANFYSYFHETLRKRGVVMRAYLLSLLVQLFGILMVACISRGIGHLPSFTALFVFVPIITTVMMVPLSISGLGIREGAFVLLFGLTGVSPEASTTISFLWFLSMAAVSLIGLVEYVRFKHRSNGKPASTI